MTLEQIAELLDRFVKDGVIRGRETIDKRDFLDLGIIARDYILFELKKGNEALYLELQVVNTEHILPIEGGKVTFPHGYNPQGISGIAELLDNSKNPIDTLLIPMAQGSEPLVSSSVFSHYFIGQKIVTFRNIPKNAKFLKLNNICGTDPNDELNNAIAFLIFKEVMKLGQLSEATKNFDTSADGNPFNDMVKAQLQQANK